MNNKKISQENRKALPKFILILIVAMLVGYFSGYMLASNHIEELRFSLAELGDVFSQQVAPLFMIVTVLVEVISFIAIYPRVNKNIVSWDQEDEEVANQIETRLSILMWISNTCLILSFLFLAASCSGLFHSDLEETKFIMIIISFFGIGGASVFIQQKCVDATKRMNPEKEGSVYDVNFQKKWMETSDEAEKIMVGKCAFKAFRVTNIVCLVLIILSIFFTMFFDTGLLATLFCVLIWLINQSVYIFETIRISKNGTNIL